MDEMREVLATKVWIFSIHHLAFRIILRGRMLVVSYHRLILVCQNVSILKRRYTCWTVGTSVQTRPYRWFQDVFAGYFIRQCYIPLTHTVLVRTWWPLLIRITGIGTSAIAPDLDQFFRQLPLGRIIVGWCAVISIYDHICPTLAGRNGVSVSIWSLAHRPHGERKKQVNPLSSIAQAKMAFFMWRSVMRMLVIRSGSHSRLAILHGIIAFDVLSAHVPLVVDITSFGVDRSLAL